MSIKKIKRLFITSFVSLSLMLGGAVAFMPSAAYAQDPATDASKSAACKATGGTYANGKCTAPGGGPSLDNIIANVINIFSIVVGIVAVIMIMVGGFKYVTSNGDSGNINSAKQTIIYAVIGLVIVAMAQFIVQYVIKTSTEVPATPTDTSQPRR